MVPAAMEYRRGTYLLSSEYASAYVCMGQYCCLKDLVFHV